MTEVGYKYLKTYQMAVVIYDLNGEFCENFMPGFEYRRTREQMVQAARSHKQNIAEGYLERSLKGYIKLLGVSLASLEELIEDFLDFLRQRKLAVLDKNHPKVRELRAFRVFWDFKKSPNSPNIPKLPKDPEEAANFLLTLAHQQSFLLNKQIKALEEKFVKEGGYTEKLFRRRLEERRKK
ncbi:MAG: four helix bundle suffix domain-containing protein [Patescibacteria group bacterium]